MISPDLLLFLVMALCGMTIMLLFDMLRAWRIVCSPGIVIVAVSDVIFCFVSTALAVGCVWNLGDGRFRLYELLGLFLGGLIYHLLLSKWILKLFLITDSAILKFVQFIFKILLTPPRFLYKILVVPTNRYMLNIRRRSKGTHDKRIQNADN